MHVGPWEMNVTGSGAVDSMSAAQIRWGSGDPARSTTSRSGKASVSELMTVRRSVQVASGRTTTLPGRSNTVPTIGASV